MIHIIITERKQGLLILSAASSWLVPHSDRENPMHWGIARLRPTLEIFNSKSLLDRKGMRQLGGTCVWSCNLIELKINYLFNIS